MRTKLLLITTLLLIMGCDLAHAESLKIQNISGRKITAIIKANEILRRVKDFTGLRVDLGHLNIMVVKNRKALNKLWQEMYKFKANEASWYDFDTNTIYTYPAITPHVLAHEFTHALVDHYAGKRWPKESAEVLPMDVDQNINLTWL